MTLLEAVVSFVLLSLVGIVCLDQARGAAQLQKSSVEWTQAVVLGETALATAVNGGTSTAPGNSLGNAEGPFSESTVAAGRVVTERFAWRAGLDLITVSVPLSGGTSYRIAKLVPSSSR